MAKQVVPAPSGEVERYATLAADPNAPKVGSVPVVVASQTVGPVSFFQKLAGYYKSLIVLIGSVLALLVAPEIGPFEHLLPPTEQKWLTLGIAALTVFLTWLKSNEHWFEDSQVNTGQ